ncbi:MAG: ThuA domain-containing protein [Verrucomicrobiota bacterium]
MKSKFLLALPLAAFFSTGVTFLAVAEDKAPAPAPAAVKPLKALLVLGGCCHDYGKQKDILKAGLEERANIVVDVCYSDDKSTKATFTCYDKADWAAGYDVIIHDECSADIKDPAVVNRILDAHRGGVPGVNLHCAMHSYRTAANVNKATESGTQDSLWFDYIGLQSSGHGPQKPIEITYQKDAVTEGLANWTTVNEELYNNIKIYPETKALAKGRQGNTETVVAWSHEYGPKKTKVFSTTIGHNNETVADDKYLSLVTRGILWTTGKLGADGKPAAGYEARTVTK